jgi:hypothetical protein
MISYCFHIVFTKIRYFNVNLKMEKIFIKIQNSFQNMWKDSLLLIYFHLEYCLLEGNLKIALSRKKSSL